MRAVFVACAFFAGCESMEPSGDVLAAVDAGTPPAPVEVVTPTEPVDEPLVPGEAPPEVVQEEMVDLVTQPSLMEADEPSGAEVVPAPEPATEEAVGDVAAASQPRWGVRVLSTLSEANPPRAVVVLPDGSEEVVRPGSMLPEAGIVVLSIAKDVVEISEIETQGMYASIRTRSIQALVAE